MTLSIDEVRNAVANELKTAGHGNELFVRSVREGGQDDGPFMRGAIAVLELLQQRSGGPGA